MSDFVPSSWSIVDLKSIASVHYGRALSASLRSSDGLIPVVGSSGIVGHHDLALVDGPCIVIGRKGAAGSVHLISESSWPIDTAFSVEPTQGIDLRYLYYFLSSLHLGQLDKSTAIPSISRDDLYRIDIRVAPSSEQLRIVEKLEDLFSDLDAGVTELRKAQSKLLKYRQSLLKAAVEGALTVDWRARNGTSQETGTELLRRILSKCRARWENGQLARFGSNNRTAPRDWRSKYPDRVMPETLGLPDLPNGWVWASVDQLGDVQLGRQRSPSKLSGSNPTPYIRAANITEGGVDLNDVLEMDFSDKELTTFALRAGDVLLTEASGSPEHVGRPAIWYGDGLMCFQNTVLRFRSEFIDPQFSFISFLAMQKLGVFQRLSGGVGINHLSSGKFSRLPVALPPLAEQAAIVESVEHLLSRCDEQAAIINASLRQAFAQRKALLGAAFSGQLVPQDPKDEPASELLARIRAARDSKAGDSIASKRGRKPKVAP